MLCAKILFIIESACVVPAYMFSFHPMEDHMTSLKNTNSSEQASWLSEREVARLLDISVSKLRADRFKRRGLPYTKFGKSVRYAKVDVQDYMMARRVTF